MSNTNGHPLTPAMDIRINDPDSPLSQLMLKSKRLDAVIAELEAFRSEQRAVQSNHGERQYMRTTKIDARLETILKIARGEV